jgi:drug/metabolite transporter (DMT)-like permease
MPLPVAAVAFTVLSWAVAFPLIHLALHEVAPIPLAAVRFMIAAVLVLAWLAWARPQLPSARDTLRFTLCGAIGIAIYSMLLNSGQQTVSPGAASFIINTQPIITALLSFLILRERLTGWASIGMLVSFVGIGMIASGQPGGLAFGAGASRVLGAACCAAIYFVLQRPLVPRYGALACAAYTLLAGAVLLAPWLVDGLRDASAGSPATVVAVLLLGIFPAALGYATWTYVLGYYGAARAAIFLYLVAPVATALSLLSAGEALNPGTLIGGTLAIAGVLLVNTWGRAG